MSCSRFNAFIKESKSNPKMGQELWRRPTKKRDKNLCREMDEVVIARPMSTDRKFLESLADKRRYDIAQEARYTIVIREALSFIDEREVFWLQHDARTKSMENSVVKV